MILLGVWLLAVGVAELVRWSPRAGLRRQLLAAAAGSLATVPLLGADAASYLWAIGLSAAVSLWLWLSCAALGPSRVRVGLPLGLLAVVALALAASNAHAPVPGGPLPHWYADLGLTSLAHVSYQQGVATTSAVVFLLNASNVVVTLVLRGAGTPAATQAGRLRGGRIIGALERLFIFGLVLAGETSAASIIVAAKGLLRFPEIQAGRTNGLGAVDELTEYFLIGSMSSWALALLLVLVAVAQ